MDFDDVNPKLENNPGVNPGDNPVENTEDNPWFEKILEEFLYYCCPECDERNQSKELFLQHAIEHHPMAKETLQMFGLKEEPYDDDNADMFYNDFDDDNQPLYYATAEYGDEEPYDDD